MLAGDGEPCAAQGQRAGPCADTAASFNFTVVTLVFVLPRENPVGSISVRFSLIRPFLPCVFTVQPHLLHVAILPVVSSLFSFKTKLT